MRTFAIALLGLIAGLVGGLVLSEIIGIIGFLLFDRLIGLWFLPVVLGVLCAVAAPLVDNRRRAAGRRSEV